jgi:hypothetical protein
MQHNTWGTYAYEFWLVDMCPPLETELLPSDCVGVDIPPGTGRPTYADIFFVQQHLFNYIEFNS